MKKLGLLAILLVFIVTGTVFAGGSSEDKIVPEYIESNDIEVKIDNYESGGWEGFRKITIVLRNISDKDIEFSAESYFEDSKGRYRMVYLPSILRANTERKVQVRRTYYQSEGSSSFGFTGNFWGITGFELDQGSGWRINNSDLNVTDFYLTLIFKMDNKIYTNTYHLVH